MRYGRLIKFLVITIGGYAAAMGILLLAIAAFGNVAQGRTGLVLSGLTLLLLAAPALVIPFSVHVAKALLLLALVCIAGLAIGLTFWPQAGVTPTPLVQGAVIAFAALLVLRVFLGRRRKGVGLGT